MLTYLLSLVLPAQLGAALPADSVATLQRHARNAEARYERLARSMAPFSWDRPSGDRCDEIVGRFCIRFDSTSYPPSTPERAQVAIARREAIEAQRRYFSAAPGARTAAGPLVRLLSQDGRASEAVSAAGAFTVLSSDTLWADLLLGMALHAAGDDSAATVHFSRALHRLPPRQQRAWRDPTWLIAREEGRMLSGLDSSARAGYERRLWQAADPFWLTRANEYWIEHLARHAESLLLQDVPVVTGMLSWAEDLRQLTVRYGTPTARTRSNSAGSMSSSLVEYWDTASRSYPPDRLLTRGFPAPPPPGERPLLYAAQARSGYAWAGVPAVVQLPHQITRFIAGGTVMLRVDGVVHARASPDSDARVQIGLFAADTMFDVVRGVRDAAVWKGDSARFTLELAGPPQHMVYSVEALDTTAQAAARARYRLDAITPDTGPIVSDILVCAPFAANAMPDRRNHPALAGRTSLVLQRGDTLGLYAEAYRVEGQGADAVQISLSLERADGRSLVAALGDWIGRAFGGAGATPQPRLTWRAERSGEVHTVAVNLPLDVRLHGQHVLVLRITDAVTGRSAETRRRILIQ